MGKVIVMLFCREGHYVSYVHTVVSWGCATCRINKPWKQLQQARKNDWHEQQDSIKCENHRRLSNHSLPATKSPVGRFDLPFTFPLPPKKSSLLICRLKHIGGGTLE